MADVPDSVPDAIDAGDGDEFVRVRFAGGRFDSHTIPFDVLPDLSAYRDLIVEVAKHLFRLRNPERQRVPRGFVESFQLGLSQVIQGNSASALAKRIDEFDHLQDQPDLGFARHLEFEAARDLVDRVIVAANDNLPLPDEFPRDLVSKFNRFGQSLRVGEHTEISHPDSQSIRYDSATRKRIVLSANATYEDALDQRFTLTGGDLSVNVVHLIDDRANRFNLSVESTELCERAISHRRHQVRIIGVGQFDRNDRLNKIASCKELIFTDDEPQQPFESRLDEISRVPAGWYREGNPAPNATTIQRMRTFVDMAVTDAGVPVPYIYPLPDGGIVAEWTRGDWEASATIAEQAGNIELHALDVEGLQEVEEEIAINDDHGLAIFGRFWARMDVARGEN